MNHCDHDCDCDSKQQRKMFRVFCMLFIYMFVTVSCVFAAFIWLVITQLIWCVTLIWHSRLLSWSESVFEKIVFKRFLMRSITEEWAEHLSCCFDCLDCSASKILKMFAFMTEGLVILTKQEWVKLR